jgi:uncharacterized protein (TIGR02271 family)
MATTEQILSWRGRELYDRDGEKIGKIDEVYLDTTTNQPEWALVNTGLFGTKSTFVPLRDAEATGDEVRVAHTKSHVKDAPRVDADGQLSEREEAELYRHYDLDHPRGDGRDSGLGDGRTTRDVELLGDDDEEARRDSGDVRGTSDDAITRSEEELNVGTSEREAGRARLRKYVETEEVSETVPVRREEVRVEREPITDANRDEAHAGGEITEAEHEVVLHEEEPVIEKRTVPKERVRLETDTVTEEREVSDQVRRERIEVEGDARDD